MDNLQRISDNKESKLTNLQKNYNLTSKTLVRILSTNMTLFLCILLPVFLIGSIWVDFGIPEIGTKFVSDGIVTVVLFVIGEIMMMRIGSDGGKLDPEYKKAKDAFAAVLEKVYEVGTHFLAVFCEWQIDVEMSNALTTRLRQLRFSREEWERVKDMSYTELKKTYGKKKAKRIVALNQLEPIDLNEFILLYDDPHEGIGRGGVPLSGEAYLKKKTHSVEMVLSCLFTGLLTVSVAMTLTSDVSVARVMYTIFKLIVLIYRMAVGYGIGAKAYNTVEVKQLEVKSDFLRNYIRFVNEKTYLKIGNKYGDIRCFVADEDLTSNNDIT
jgi:hypothetical protein